MPGNRPNQRPLPDLHDRASENKFSERHYESVIYWLPWCPVGVIVRAGLKLSGFDAPYVPSSNPRVSEINSDTGLKSQNREILFRWTDWLKRGKDERVVELSRWYSHLGVLQWWKSTRSSCKNENVCPPFDVIRASTSCLKPDTQCWCGKWRSLY